MKTHLQIILWFVEIKQGNISDFDCDICLQTRLKSF